MNVNKDPNSKKIFVVDSENVDVFSLLKHLYFVSDYSLVLTGCPPPPPHFHTCAPLAQAFGTFCYFHCLSLNAGKTVSKSVSQSLNQRVSNSLIQ